MENKGWGDASDRQSQLNRRADLAPSLVGFLWDMEINEVGPRPEQRYQVLGLASMPSPSLWTCLPFVSRC